MADCIWMETALIASSLAEHQDIACAWVHKQGAIECDLSNETTYQELVEELRLRPLEARRLAAFFCPKVAERQQQPVKSEPDSVVPHPITEPPALSPTTLCIPDGSNTDQHITKVNSASDTEGSHIAASDQQSAVLPDSWVETISRSTGMPYFFNLKSGTSQYNRPTQSVCTEPTEGHLDFLRQIQQTAGPSALSGNATEQPIVHENIESNTKLKVSNKEPTLLPAGWVERIGRSTKKQYFFNLKNGTTQVIRPVESAYPELTERPCDLPSTLTFGPVLMKQVEKALSKMPRLWNGLHAASLKTQPVSGGCLWPERLVQALGHLECAQGVVAEIFGDGVEAAGLSNTSGLSNKCTKLEIEQAAVSPKIQQLLAKFMSYGCSSDVIKRLSKHSEDVLEVALAYTLSLTNPRSPNGVAISNVRRAEAKSKGWAYKKRTWSKCIWNYNQEETDCCRCQQPKDIASDCITDIQALDQSDQPIASAEGMGSGKVASTQAAPAKRKRRSSKKSNSPTKRQRRTTQKSDYSKKFDFSDI